MPKQADIHAAGISLPPEVMLVGSTPTIALSNMAEVVSRSSTRANLASVSHASKHLLSTSRKVPGGCVSKALLERLGVAKVIGICRTNVAVSLPRGGAMRAILSMIGVRPLLLCLAGARQLRSCDRCQDLLAHPFPCYPVAFTQSCTHGLQN